MNNKAKMRILVTGASGFIGASVIQVLCNQGFQVCCLVRSTSNIQRIEHLNWQRFEGDTLDYNSVVKAMRGCDGIIHLAGTSDWNKISSKDMWSSIVNGTKNVFKAAKSEGCRRAVFVSSMSAVNGSNSPELMNETTPCSLPKNEPAFEYVRAKQTSEKNCLGLSDNNFKVIIVNPPETYGPNDINLITAKNLIDLYSSKPTLVPKGGSLIGHVDDVAQGIVAAYVKGRAGERYILGGENTDFFNLVTTLFNILEEDRRIIVVPTFLMRTLTKICVKLNLTLPYNPIIIPYATRYWYFDTSKASKELGIEFRNLRETLKPTVAWLKEAGLINTRR